ncbi:hypothetical protein GCM10023148_25590 [Actinokineospora soli]
MSAHASVTRLQVPEKPNVVVLLAEGEFDLSTRHVLIRALGRALDEAPRVVILDLARVRFMDAACVGALVRAHDRAQHDVIAFRLVAPMAHVVSRCFEVTGLDGELFFYPTFADALVGPLRPTGPDESIRREPLVLEEDH